MSGGDEGYVAAGIEFIYLAYFERLGGVCEIGHAGTAETKVHRPVEFGCRLGRLHGLVIVAGHEHRHTGKGAHEGEVFHGLVSGAVFPEGDSGMGRCEFDVRMTVGHFLTHLVVNTSGYEFREGTGERYLAGKCETGRHANHIGFRDAALYETVREFSRKSIHLEGALEVRRKRDNILVGTSGFHQSGTEAAAGVLFACIDILFHTNSLPGFL